MRPLKSRGCRTIANDCCSPASIDEILKIDDEIRRQEITGEIANAKAVELRTPIYAARIEAKRWAGVELPTDAELDKLFVIVSTAYPGEYEHRPKEFKRAMLAVGRLGRLGEPGDDRFFVSMLDDANEILRARRLESVNADMFCAAILAWGDVPWREADPSVGQPSEIALAKLNQGVPAKPKWRIFSSAKRTCSRPCLRGTRTQARRHIRFREFGSATEMGARSIPPRPLECNNFATLCRTRASQTGHR